MCPLTSPPAAATLTATLSAATLFVARRVHTDEIAFLADFNYTILIVINYIIFGVFALGIVVTFCLPYREPLYKGGGIVTDHKKIAVRYLRSWFIFDFLSTLPFDDIVTIAASGEDGSADNSKLIQSTRLIRLVRLVRLLKLGRLLRATRIIARVIERLEGKSEMLNM